ncbi:PRC-barrel domain-containing protein [Paenibacillus alba]|uniref:PRC-barrel domain-containing protein n=1 Tax=Paenibacillus alba TaxID=1197127 RepID=A0ABU6GEK3_9BACL|nr:PRC-barrel domain-containing protein [Paenibacillus alba]MEC0232586.1 PRC-barrel domain-containing protein [Paenibacillus alba]NQX67085.1 PRC-barrel domain-containing protein [Paenibacillus alba]
MRKAHDLIGLPVITVDSGKQIGQVKDLLIGPEWNIRGIVLEVKVWFSALRYIPWEGIVAAGEDAITIPNEMVIREFEHVEECHALLDGSRKIKGLPIITVGGHKLGVVEDVYLNQDWGKQIVGYELSEGFISDLKEGRRWLPVPESATKGEDAIIVPVHCAQEMEELFVSKEE